MTYPGQRKPPDYSLKTAVRTVGLMTAAGLLLAAGCLGAAALADNDDEAPPAVEATRSAEPTGRDNTPTAPTVVSASPSAAPSPTLSPTLPAAPKPPVKRTPAAPKTTKAPPPPPDDEPDEDVYYANCSEARAAGAAPLYRGEPGYRSGLDRDGDGVACES